MTIDIGQCRFCHRPAVQWMDIGDGRQDMGLCSRHSTVAWQMEEVIIAVKDLWWVIIEAFADGMVSAGIKWRTWKRGRR